jgi:hypothetical protein
MLVLCKVSAKKLRVRAGKTGSQERWEGHSNFLLSVGQEGAKRRKNFAARGLIWTAGQRP